MTNPKPSHTRRRIAIAVVVFIVGVGWFVAYPAYQRHRAIQEIERVGGRVDRKQTGPQWLRKWGIGFGRVTGVHLNETERTDDGLKHLGSLTTLTELSLSGTQITDNGLKHLSGLASLVILSLDATQVTDDGVKMLQESLPNCDIEWK